MVKASTAAGAACADRGPDHAWNRGDRLWYAYYGSALVITLLILLTSGAPARAKVIATAVLLAMACWYLIVGRPLTRDRPAGGPARQTAYLGVLFALFVVAETQSLTSTFILIAVCPQCFFAVSSFRRALGFVVAFNLAPPLVAVFTLTGTSRGSVLAEMAGIAALGAAFSVVFGSWITGIIGQSRSRAELIERLEATRAELAAANREAGVLAERQRLAGEIHDTLAQGFASIVLLIQAAEPELGRDQQAVRRYLDTAGRTARENLAEARALVAALTPAHLESGSLDDALRRLAERSGAEHGLPATFEVMGAVRPLHAAAEVTLLRVCQEALANVRRHAGASRASVRLAYHPNSVRLEVTDDGTGFDPAKVNGGYGLRGMRGRVGERGGTLVVRSAPGAGTTVRAEVPA